MVITISNMLFGRFTHWDGHWDGLFLGLPHCKLDVPMGIYPMSISLFPISMVYPHHIES